MQASTPTYSVGELCEQVRELLGQAIQRVWVAGEVQRVRQSQRGHLYFELIEKGSADQIVGKLEAVVWRSDLRGIQEVLGDDVQISDGQEIRCRAELDLYPPFGRLQLVVREVDPLFSLGLLEKRRRETLEALAKAGLLEKNGQLSLSPVARRIALVTSSDSAAYHDFVSTLRESGFAFEILHLQAAMQGRDAEPEVVRALSRAAQLPVDCVVLIRGGGSRTDLAAFDSRSIAEAVAGTPVAVITGLGHEIDQAIADSVAHTATKTPTRAAEFLVAQMTIAENRLAEVENGLRRSALEPVGRARRSLEGAERRAAVSRFRVSAQQQRIATMGARLGRSGFSRLAAETGRLELQSTRFGSATSRLLETGAKTIERKGKRLVGAARARLREVQANLAGWNQLLIELAPERTLARGFSITRNEQGRLMRSSTDIKTGERLISRLAKGEIISRVEKR